MRLSRRDWMATGLVALALLLYLMWATGSALPNMDGTRATGTAILLLGFLASASAVVPSFVQLLHGSKAYLAITAALGMVAAVAGSLVLFTASATALRVVMAAMVALWLIATLHHAMLAEHHMHPVRRS